MIAMYIRIHANSQGGLVRYLQSNFYSLTDDPSTRHRYQRKGDVGSRLTSMHGPNIRAERRETRGAERVAIIAAAAEDEGGRRAAAPHSASIWRNPLSRGRPLGLIGQAIRDQFTFILVILGRRWAQRTRFHQTLLLFGFGNWR